MKPDKPKNNVSLGISLHVDSDADFKLIGGILNWQVCRPSGIDPRISIRRVADQAGIARSTAWDRLQAWRDSGFYGGHKVLPNPLLLGTRMVQYHVALENETCKKEFWQAAELMDGFAGGVDLLGPTVVAVFVGDGAASFNRRASLLAKLREVTQVEGPMVYPNWESSPPKPDATGWRLLQVLADDADATISSLATKLGLTERTVKRRYLELIEKRQALFRPEFDFRKMPGATAFASISFDPTLGEKVVGRRLIAALPGLVPLSDPPEDINGQPLAFFVGLLHAPNPAAFQAISETLSSVEGVKRVEISFPIKFRVRTLWCKERLDMICSELAG